MATATRGDLTQSATGTAKVTKVGGKLVAVATIDAQNASSVAEGQSATVFFLRGGGSFPQAGQSGMPQPQGSGMPQGAPSGMPQPQGSGMPQARGQWRPVLRRGGQGGFPGGGQRGGTAGTVTAVTTNADGSAAATISLDKLPSGAKDGSTGFARIEVKVLASNVILIPTAAVKGSGELGHRAGQRERHDRDAHGHRRAAVRGHDRDHLRAERGRERRRTRRPSGASPAGAARAACPSQAARAARLPQQGGQSGGSN